MDQADGASSRLGGIFKFKVICHYHVMVQLRLDLVLQHHSRAPGYSLEADELVEVVLRNGRELITHVSAAVCMVTVATSYLRIIRHRNCRYTHAIYLRINTNRLCRFGVVE